MSDRIEKARSTVTRLERALGAAEVRAEAATPGGLTDYDSAILSGIRRKPNHKADARRIAAYDREAALYRDLERARRDLAALEAAAAREATETALRAALTPEAVRAARFIRDRYGWHKVVRVSAKSVTVETGFSWTERIALDKVLEART